MTNLSTFQSRFGSDLDQAKPTILANALWDFYDRNPSNREKSLSDLTRLLSSRSSVLTLREEGITAALMIEGGKFAVWAIDPRQVLRPQTIKIVLDGKLVFEKRTAPETDQPVYPTGVEAGPYRRIELWVDRAMTAGGPFAPRPIWEESRVRDSLSNYLTWVGETHRKANQHNDLWTKLPDTMSRLDARADEGDRSRIPPFCRFLAARLESRLKLSTPLSIANWIISDVFEDAGRRAIFCLTDATLAILKEPVFNRRAVKNDISLALFAFWRRHYPHIDVFSDEGLRTIQYKFATAPFVSDKNNALLVSDDVRKSLSAVADPYRGRDLPWSWYWLFLLQDQGQAERMKDEKFALLTSFKELILDIAVQGRVSFSPHAWRAYWTATAVPGFTRFDLAVISILGSVASPALALAEQGVDYWRKRLQADFYEKIPALGQLSATTTATPTVVPRPELPERDLVIIGHANGTGLGRNLFMFVEGLAGFDPLILSADDGSCINPEKGYDQDLGVRAKVVLLCVNAHRAPEVIARFAAVCEGAHVIAFYVWETDRPPENHVFGATIVDEIWAPTNYVVDGYRKVTAVPVHLVKKGLHAPLAFSPMLDRFRHAPDEFLFLCVADFGSSIIRKNPLDAIKAFQAAFTDGTEHVRLLIKIRHVTPGHWSNVDGYWEEVEERVASDPRISLVEGDLSEQEYWALMWTIDCIVSLHRSEGFGYTIADAMLAGKPVISSDYSGSQDFCTRETSWPVRAFETPAIPELLASQGFIGNWSTPEVASAAEAMRDVFEHPEGRHSRTAAAKRLVEADYSFEGWSKAISARVQDHLDQR